MASNHQIMTTVETGKRLADMMCEAPDDDGTGKMCHCADCIEDNRAAVAGVAKQIEQATKKRRIERANQASDWVFLDNNHDNCYRSTPKDVLILVDLDVFVRVVVFSPSVLTPFYRQVYNNIIVRDACEVTDEPTTQNKAATRLLGALIKHFEIGNAGQIEASGSIYYIRDYNLCDE